MRRKPEHSYMELETKLVSYAPVIHPFSVSLLRDAEIDP